MSFSTRALSVCAPVLLLALLVGCDALTGLGGGDSAPNDPYALTAADSTTVEPSVKVTLQTPDTVALGDAFGVQAHLHNQSGDTVSVVTGTPALYDFGVYDGAKAVPVKGTLRLIAQVQTEHDISPTEHVQAFELRAVRASDAEDPIAPGSYSAQLALNWTIEGTRVQDTLETTLVFRDE